MNSKTLKIIRNVLIAAAIVGGFLLYLQLPERIPNTKFFHIGFGESGPRQGALVILLLPLFSLIRNHNTEEVHSEDPEEKAKLEGENEVKNAKTQVLVAAAELVVIWVIMGAAVIFTR